MSLEAAVQFMDKVATNEALLAQIQKDTEGKEDKAALAAIVAAGKAEGCDFTAEEAVQARNGLVIHLKQQAGEELTAEELAQVSGGIAWLQGATPRVLSWATYDAFSPKAIGTGAVFTSGHWTQSRETPAQRFTNLGNSIAGGATTAWNAVRKW